MRTNTQEAVLSAYIGSVGKRTPREAAQDATELCRLATSLNRCYAVYLDLPDGSYNSFGGRECGYGIGR